MTVELGERVLVLSELEARDEAFDVTNAQAIAALRDAEDGHFWHRTRNELIERRLRGLGVGVGARVIELGCGGGCVTAHLARAGYRVVGVDGHGALVRLAATRAPRARFWVHDLSRGVEELPERGFDVAGLFDVIEHLDEPIEALRAALSLVRPGGLVVGTVPAMSLLWSQVDVQAGHRRRYEKSTLGEELSAVGGADTVEVVAFNHVLVPLMLVQRRLVSRGADQGEISAANLGVPRPWLNNLAALVIRAERGVRILDRLAGASLWFALRKREA